MMPRRRRSRILSGQRDRFRSAVQNELYFRHEVGEITEYELEKAIAASNNDRVIRKWMRRYDEDSHTGPLLSAGFDNIKTWIKENWVTILKGMLTLVMIFLDEDDHADF